MDQNNQNILHGVQYSTQGSAPDDPAIHGLASQNTSHNGLGHDRPQLVNLPDNDSPAANLMNNDTLTAASDAAVGGSVGGGGGNNGRRHGSHGGSRRETGHDASPTIVDKKYRSIAGNHHHSNGNSHSQDGAVTEGGKHVDSSASRSAAGSGRSRPSKQHLSGESGSGGSGSNTNSKSSRKRSRHGNSHQEHLNCKKSSTGATSTEGSKNNGLPSSGNGATAGLGSAGPGAKMGELIHSTTDGAAAGDSLLMNMPLAPGITAASNAGSIVSFGLNFNFDSTSSPSNSDSGDAGNKGGEGSSEEDGNGNTNQNLNAKSSVVAMQQDINEIGTSSLKSTCRRSRTSLPGGSGSGTTSKGKLAAGKCGNGSSNNGESGCKSKNSREERFDNSSDSINNCDSGGSASGGSNSGNDGSSGGKSTISSLTTSSNQDWVATSEAVVRNLSVGGEGCLNARNRAGERMNRDVGVVDGKTSSNKIDKATSRTSGNKRKKFPGSDRNDTGNDEDSTGGYNTDEEQWGGNRNNGKDNHAGGSALAHKQHHHIGMSSPVSMPNASTAFKGPTIGGNGPPLKHARFNDQLAGMASMAPVPSAGESAQNGISSLSSGTAQPAVTPTARTPLTSSDANAVTSSSNQNDLSPAVAASNHSGKRSSGKHHAATMDQRKREERNAREKERSCRIARQIDDLRNLLSRGGVIVAKGTKSSVLAEAANYINMLQEQQCRWEMDRQALIQQVQQAGGVPNLNNQQQHSMLPPGVPQGVVPVDPIAQQQQEIQNSINSVSPYDYKYVFNNSSVGMAIASMGGAFVDCNEIFCQLSGYTREEVCSMTIFNMTSRDDLQHAFELISQMITPQADNNQEKPNSIVLRGAMNKRDDLGLSISLIKGEHGIVKCFCITLVKILSVSSQADTVAYEMELPRMGKHKQTNVGFGVSPAYTSG
mmetsp:Transcript_7252/g.15181  ORF Transcript_7252/g.15181 Transcript_7252/m.15181 type:complete len:933 (-) Transcript_7252:393-3191(-)